MKQTFGTHLLLLLATYVIDVSCWTPQRHLKRILNGKFDFSPSDASVTKYSPPRWQKVPIHTLDSAEVAREVKLADFEISTLVDTMQKLPDDAKQGVTGTHVVVVPNVDQQTSLFDPMLGALGFMGFHGVLASIPLRSWRQSLNYLTASVKVLRVAGREHNIPWEDLYDEDMLSRALFPIFSDLAAASENAGLPSCQRLVLVGCEDSAWALHAFLCELDRMKMTPQIPVTLVALGLSTESLLSRAIMKVHPEKLAGVKYLSIHGEVSQRQTPGSIAPGPASGTSVAYSSQLHNQNELSSQGIRGVNMEDSGVTRERREQLEAPRVGINESEERIVSPSLHMSESTNNQQRMACMEIDGVNEECIFSPSGWDGPMGPWFADPTTVASWIGKCL